MNEILRIQEIKRHRYYLICEQILTCIRSKIAFSSHVGVSETSYTFKTVNFFMCPIISTPRSRKIKKYVVTKLREEGFTIIDVECLLDEFPNIPPDKLQKINELMKFIVLLK